MLGQPRPVGTEFRVNLNTESKQHNPVAAFNAAGSALVVWENDNDGLRGPFLRRRRHAADRRAGPGGEPEAHHRAGPRDRDPPQGPGDRLPRLRRVPARLDRGAGLRQRRPLHRDTAPLLDRDVYLQKFSAAGAAEGTPVRLNTHHRRPPEPAEDPAPLRRRRGGRLAERRQHGERGGQRHLRTPGEPVGGGADHGGA